MKSRLTIVLWTTLAVVLMLGALLAVAAGLFDLREKSFASERLVIKTHEIIEQIDEIQALVRGAESAQRGYVISGKVEYLGPFAAAKDHLTIEFVKLGDLLKDEPAQVRALRTLRDLSKTKMDELAETIRVRESEGLEASRKIVIADRGLHTMEQIRAAVDAMELKQRQDLELQSRELEELDRAQSPYLLGLVIIAIGALTVSSFWTVYFLRQRDQAQGESRVAEKEAREAESRLRSILANMPTALFQLDPRGKFVSLNPAAEELLGYSQEELLGQSMHEVVHPKCGTRSSSGEHHCALWEGLNGDKSTASGDDYLIRRDGSNRQIHLVKWQLFKDGQVIGNVVSCIDVTERKEQEKRAHAQYAVASIIASTQDNVDESIRAILKNVGELFGMKFGAFWKWNEQKTRLICAEIWSDPKEPLTRFEEQSRNLSFAEGEGLPGRTIKSGFPIWVSDISRESWFARREAAEAEHIKTAICLPLKVLDFPAGVIEFYALDSRDPDDDAVQILSSIASQMALFFERNLVKNSLADSKERFDLAIQGSHDGIWDWDLPKGTAFLSSRCIEILGYPPGELNPTFDEWSNMVHPEDKQRIMAAVFAHFKHQAPYDVEYRMHRKTGEYGWYSARGQAIWNDKGRAIRFIGSLRDISERKETEKRVSEFYSMVSHELRSPLTSIRGSLGLLEGGFAGSLPEKGKKFVEIARVECDRLIRLINDILDVRKIEAGKLDLKIEDLKPLELVETALQGLAGMAAEAQVQLTENVSARGSIEGDRDRILQVLTNLISNSIKFSPSDSIVAVNVETTPDSLCKFSVVDSGPGIPKDQIYKLFEKFQQLDSSDSRMKGGTGLGLAISKAIVEQHGGKIGVDSTVGLGSIFWFELPYKIVIDLSGAEGFDQSGINCKHTALLVEDDDKISLFLKMQLAGEGFKLARAANLAEADKFLATNSPDVIILDLLLPDGNGLDLMQRMRSNPKTEHIPIIVITGSDTNPDEYASPMLLDWLPKPFDENKLRQSLKVALRNTSGPPRALVVEDDPATRSVLVDQLKNLGMLCFEARNGVGALEIARREELDLIILDVFVPAPDGFDIVAALRHDRNRSTALLVYTSADLTDIQKNELTLGMTRHLIKTKTTQADFVKAVRELLTGLVKK